MAAAELRRLVRQVVRALCAAALALVLVTCTDNPVGPARGGIAYVRLQPVFDAYSRVAPLTLDSVRVVVIRLPADTLADVGRDFSPTSTSVRLDIPVRLEQTSEDLEVVLELYAGTILLFSGSSTVRVAAGTPNPVAPIPVTYQGPGANLAVITLGPRDTTVSFGAALDMRASAVDSQQAPVPQFYVSWSATGGAIDASGRFTAPSARDTVLVRAVSPTGIGDSTRVFVMAPPAQLVLVSGDAQNATIGARLPLPLVVRVNGSDGQPVPGVTVNFAAVTGGGSVDSATYVSDAQGLARMGATLGLTAGSQTFAATVTGLNTVTFSMTAAGGGIRTWTGAVNADWNTAGNWSPAALPGAGDSVVIPTFVPNAPDLNGNATIGALVLRGTGTNLTVAGNLTVQRGIALPDTSQLIVLTSGGLSAGALTLSGAQALVHAFGGGVTVTGATTISGNNALLSATGPGPNALGPVTLSGSQAFLDQAGGTAGGVTVSGTGALYQAEGSVALTGTPALQLTGNTSFFSTSTSVPTVVTFNGNVVVGGTGSFLSAGTGGARLVINGDLQTTGSGYLVQGSAGDTIVVNGDASFGGGDEAGSLTAGALFVSGDFTQSGLATSFAASGSHTVFLNGAGAQAVSFSSPGFSASRFQNVVVANAAGQVTIGSDAFASGTAGVVPGVPRILSGNGGTLFTTILNVGNFTFNNLLLNFTGSTVLTFDTVAFQGYAPTATPLTIAHPGAASPLQLFDVSFAVTPTTGFYFSATDTNPTDGVPLVIDMLNPSPAFSGGRVQLAGGATTTWPSVSPSGITWTGTVSTAWTTAGNWTPARVPTATDDVTIPGGAPRYPVLTANATALGLTVATGATLDLGAFTLTAAGSVDAPGVIAAGAGQLLMTGGGATVAGIIQSLGIATGSPLSDVVVSGPLTVSGTLAIQSGRLQVGASIVTAATLVTSGTGILAMTNAAGQVFVNGNATFGGEDPTGVMTAGELRVRGNLSQTVGVTLGSLVASGTNRVILDGTGPQTVSFASPGTGGSRMNDFEIAKASGSVTFATAVAVTGQFIEALGTPVTATGSGVTLTTGGISVNGLTFDNVLVELGAGTLGQFDNVAFINYASTAIPLRVTRPSGTFTFTGLSFSVTPTTGFYLRLEDTAPTDGQVLTLNLVSPTPVNNGGQVQLVGNPALSWPAATPGLSWTGTVSTDWNNGANWSGGSVPTASDDVTIPGGTPNSPLITGNQSVNDLNTGLAATLTVTGQLDVNGSVTAGGTITGAGTVRLRGAGKSAGGPFPTLEISSGASYTFSAPVTVGGDLTVNGTLDPAGQSLIILNHLNVFGAGLLVMQNPSDNVGVGGNATFGGAASSGFLTDGLLAVAGHFVQTNSNADNSFSASGNHVTSLNGNFIQQVNFITPGSGGTFSHFANLNVSNNTGGGVDFVRLNIMVVEGQLISAPSTGLIQLFTSNGGQLRVGGVDVRDLVLNNLPLTIVSGAITRFDRVTFGGFQGDETQLTVNHPGAATPFVFDAVTFQDPLTTGRYLLADDVDGPSLPALTINLTNPTPTTPSAGSFLAQNGAVINWPAAAPLTWTGQADNNWNNTANWSGGAVPTINDDVFIPAGTPNDPVAGTIFTRDLTIQTGAILTASDHTFNVAGDLDAQGLIGGPGGCCNVSMTGSGVTARGNLEGFSLDIAAGSVVTLTGALTVSGSASVSIAGELIVGGQTLTVGTGAVGTIAGTGLLTMTNPADLVIAFAVGFNGGDQTGRLTQGEIQVDEFVQGGVPTSFVASGNHLVSLSGVAGRIELADPVNSRFNDLDVTGIPGSIDLVSDITVGRLFSSNPGGAAGPTVTGNGGFYTITTAGIDVNAASGFAALTLNQVRLVVSGGVIFNVSDISFTNQDPGVTQLTVNDVGQAAPFVFDNLVFQTAPGAGLYLAVNDLDGSAPFFQVSLTSAQPASPGSFTQATNGASLLWNGVAPAVQWTGQSSSNWDDPGNWSGGAVPGAFTNVAITSGTPNPPVLNTNASVNDLTIGPGVTLNLATFGLTVGGHLDNGGSVAATPSAGGLVLAGTGKLVRGAMTDVTTLVGGTYTLSGRLVVGGATTGDLTVNPGGLTLNGQTVEVSGIFATAGAGVVIMQNGLDSLIVRGDAIFAGGNSTAAMTNGVFRLGGNLSQAGGDPGAFSPQGAHKTLMEEGTPFTPTEVFFADPASSHFAHVEFANPSGVQLSSRAMATISGTATAVASAGEFSTAGNTFEVGGNFSTVGTGVLRMPLSGDSVIVSGNAMFAGGGTLGLLTEGVLVIGGGFSQAFNGTGDEFHPSGNHLTEFTGANPTVSFANPGNQPGTSHFQRVRWIGNGTLTLDSDLYAHDLFGTQPGANGTIRGNAQRTIDVGLADVDGATFDQVSVGIRETTAPVAHTFKNVTFTNYPALNANVLFLILVGGAGVPRPVTFDNVDFLQPFTGGSSSFYVSAAQLSGNGLVVDMTNSNQGQTAGGNGAAFSQAGAGVTINWP